MKVVPSEQSSTVFESQNWLLLHRALNQVMVERGFPDDARAATLSFMQKFYEQLETDFLAGVLRSLPAAAGDDGETDAEAKTLHAVCSHMNEVKANLFYERFNREMAFQTVLGLARGEFWPVPTDVAPKPAKSVLKVVA